MVKRFVLFLSGIILLGSLYGCVALFAGAAGGAGTAAWLSGKLVQQVDASFDRSFNATRNALDKLNLEVVKVTRKNEVAQFISKYLDSKKVWVDLHKVGVNSTKIEVRVGMGGDKEAAREILDQILAYL